MAEPNVAVIPGSEPNIQPGADKNNVVISPQIDGSRADTSRVADELTREPKEKAFTFKEDRTDWVPRPRLNEESGKRAKLEQSVAQLQQELELRDKRLRLAMGLEVPSKEDQELNEMREGLYKLNPKLKLLDKLDEDAIERLLHAAESAESTSQATWARHREEQLAVLGNEVADLLGVDKLTDAQAQRLHRDFRSHAREEAAKRERAERTQDPNYDFSKDFVTRYERGDKSLLKEFAKSFIDEWVTPARRQASASAVTRFGRPVPRGERTRQPLTQGPPKIDYNDEKAFKDALLSARRSDEGV